MSNLSTLPFAGRLAIYFDDTITLPRDRGLLVVVMNNVGKGRGTNFISFPFLFDQRAEVREHSVHDIILRGFCFNPFFFFFFFFFCILY